MAFIQGTVYAIAEAFQDDVVEQLLALIKVDHSAITLNYTEQHLVCNQHCTIDIFVFGRIQQQHLGLRHNLRCGR